MNDRRAQFHLSALTIAFCVSLAAHGAFLAFTAVKEIQDFARRGSHLPGLPRAERSVKVSLLPPKEARRLQEYTEIGEATGQGTASHAAKGDEPLRAKEADEDQPLFSRELAGPIGEGGAGPLARAASASIDPAAMQVPRAATPAPRQPSRDDDRSPRKPPEQTQAPEPNPVVDALPPPEPALPPVKVPNLTVAIVTPEPAAERHVAQQPPSSPSPANPVAPAAPPQPAAVGDGRKPGLPSSAVPARLNETDSDPFRRFGTAVFHDGKLEVRSGRKAKLKRPDFQFNAGYDVLALQNPVLVLKLSIDVQGNVSDVEVIHSSGSVNLDQPTRVAAYEWWFEPTRDVAGHPVPDVFLFPIAFR